MRLWTKNTDADQMYNRKETRREKYEEKKRRETPESST